MTKLITATFILTTAACATTGTAMPRGPGRPAAVSLDLAPASDGVEASFPALVSTTELPTADRMRVALLADGHAALTAGIRMCVARDGSIENVAIERTSGVDSFDQAIVKDLASWRYERYPAPAGLHVCRPLTLTYQP